MHYRLHPRKMGTSCSLGIVSWVQKAASQLFRRNLLLFHMPKYIIVCDQFYQAFPALVLQATNTQVRRAEYEATLSTQRKFVLHYYPQVWRPRGRDRQRIWGWGDTMVPRAWRVWHQSSYTTVFSNDESLSFLSKFCWKLSYNTTVCTICRFYFHCRRKPSCMLFLFCQKFLISMTHSCWM